MIRISKGEIHHITDKETREFSIHHYVEFYTQPTIRRLIYKAYHFWDIHFMWWHRFCDRIDMAYDNWTHRKTGRECCKHAVKGFYYDKDHNQTEAPAFCTRIPYSARQDCKCYELSQHGRMYRGRVYLDEIPKDKMTEHTILGPPNRELEGVSDVDSMGE